MGAGPAGIVLALTLAELGRTVVLLEAGHETPTDQGQRDLGGAQDGRSYFDLRVCRLRVLGGGTFHWNGCCRALDPEDLAVWPSPAGALSSHYSAAARWCELGGSVRFDARGVVDESLRSVGDSVRSVLFRFSRPTRFGVRYGSDLRRHPRIRLLTRTPVVDLSLAEPGRPGVTCLLDGRRVSVRCRAVVLAAGGIENARLLLWAARHPEPSPLGRLRWLGAGFADHLNADVGIAVGVGPSSRWAPFDDVRRVTGGFGRAALALTPEVRRRHGLRNASIHLEAYRPSPAEVARVRQLTVSTGSWFRLVIRAEASCVAASRITLSDTADAQGVAQPRLTWVVARDDLESMDRTAHLMAVALTTAGVARVRLDQTPLWDRPESDVTGGYHQLGTTRMGRSATEGVVDAEGEVFGVPMLFVVGGSTFPSIGMANPTFSIVAQAVRLGHRLAMRLP